MSAAFERVAVVGLGLIGGSIAKDLAARGVEVEAYDPSAASLDEALSSGVVSRKLDASLTASRADVVVIATPVDAAVDILRTLARSNHRATLITDVGSTKGRIVAEADALGLSRRFVGSHPMAGDHRSGWPAARRGLFAGARVYLSAPESTPAELVARADAFWRELDAHPMTIEASAHDQTLAWTSHLPHLVSAALALALGEAGVERDELGPGGRDITRLAGSSPEMWSAIAVENAAAIEAALAAAEREVASFRRLLSRADAGELHTKFAAARAWFEA
ncbi:MAG TPA: prephenate dehydrogenase [Gemmatimonadaceae bacterium]|nr:prephenate dehydrogenase [Gemmatimonadaceae bacterium]